MLVAWDAEKPVWDRIFSPAGLDVSCSDSWPADRQIKPPETSLLVTEPYFNLPNIAETYDQMVFEEWEFASYYRCTREFLLVTKADRKRAHWCRTAACLATRRTCRPSA